MHGVVGSSEPGVGPLPDPVRNRVVALVAEALGALDPDVLPPALRRVTGFTPARRARAAATPIAVALEADARFRDRVAAHVRVRRPDIAAALADGASAPAADPVELAALAYLLRVDGWPELVRAAGERAAEHQVAAAAESAQVEMDRLRSQLNAARDDARLARERGRDQVAGLKTDNATLRRRLAEARRGEQSARTAAEQAARRLDEVQKQGRGETAQQAAEQRRLRARLEELESQLGVARRGSRDQKGTGTIRARLLIDTLADAVQGLRRELALPAVDVLPADTVLAAEPDLVSAADAAGRALAADDPALLDQLLALPRVHLLVDGYNVTKSGYPSLALDRQRQRLQRDLAPVGARTGAEVTVVFDGAELATPPPVAGPRGVRVRFSPPGVSADELLSRLLAAEPQGRPLVVVSTDREVAQDAVAQGARAVPAQALLGLLARS